MTALRNIPCYGDSQTDSDAGYGVDGFDTWPAKLQRSLVDAGYSVRCRSFGISGDTSTGLLARVSDGFLYAKPDIAIVYIGVNDPGAAISQAQTQANLQAIVKAIKHRALGDGFASGSSVAGQANLPRVGKLGDRYVVMADTSTTGGRAAFDPQHHPRIAGDYSGAAQQTVWEYRDSVAGELGWGRVALAATPPLADLVATGSPILGCKNIVIVSTNYLNFTTGGDTPTTPYATYATVRAAQQAAVAAETGNGSTVVYADLYNLQRGLIVAGPVPDFSSVAYDQTKSWHWNLNNQHHNAFGQGNVEQAAAAAIPSAWLA